MAYVNFKEERYKCLIELEKRRNNNKELNDKLSRNFSINDITPYEKYSFRKIKNRTLYSSKTLNEEDFTIVKDKQIVCSEFFNCNISNVKFKSCTFISCKFKSCEFTGGGAIFENCIFIYEDSLSTPALNKKSNLSCEFKNCSMYIKFNNCDISYVIIDNCNIVDTNFELTDMSSAIIINSHLKGVTIEDSNLSSVKLVNNSLDDFEFDDDYLSKFDEKTFFDKIKPVKKTKQEYEGLYKIYETIADQFKDNSLNNNFGEYYYLCKKAEAKSIDKVLPRINSFMYRITAGYGERILTPVITSLIIVFIFTFLYLIFGFEIEGNEIIYISGVGMPESFREFLTQFNEAFNLSLGFFTIVGANNSLPLPQTYILSNIEMIIGTIIIGIGIGLITRKLIR